MDSIVIPTIHHSALPGLDLDTHEQYLLADGSRALAGDWDLGGHDLTNGGSILGTSLTSTTGLITGANGKTFGVGVSNQFIFTSAGATNVRLRFVNDLSDEIFASMPNDGSHFEISRNAIMPVYFFEAATSGKNPQVRFYGDTIGGPNYGFLQFEASSNFVIGTDVYDLSIEPASGDTWVMGDLGVSGSVTASEYFGGSDIHLREDAITFGSTNDSASIFLNENAPGAAWIFCTDNVNVVQLIFDSEKIILDAAKNTETPTVITRADDTIFNFKENTRSWLEASWDNRQVIFGEDIYHEQMALPVMFKDKFDGIFVKIDSFVGTIDLKGDITLDPVDGGHWAGAKVLVNGKLAFTQTDGNEYIDSLSDGKLDIEATTSINFRINTAEQLQVLDGIFQPTTTNDIDIGTSSLLIKDFWQTGKHQFRDSAIGIYSQADTFLDVFADGAVRIGDSSAGAPTNYTQFAPNGSQAFVGTAGLPFGSYKGNEIAWAQAAAQNTWYTISDAGITAGQTNNTTFQNNQELLVAIAGKYIVNYYLSMKCSIAGKHVLSAPEINGVEQLDGQSHYDFPAANTEESWSGVGILNLAAGDVVSVGVATDDVGNPTLSVYHVGLVLGQWGGT